MSATTRASMNPLLKESYGKGVVRTQANRKARMMGRDAAMADRKLMSGRRTRMSDVMRGGRSTAK